MDHRTPPLRAGDYVEVRSAEEIFATLDGTASLERLPFMPEMLQYCGQKLRIASVAHKTCDTIAKSGGRRLENAFHLEGVRCDGRAHGGCQAKCLIFWKEQWLKRPGATAAPVASASNCDETGVILATRKQDVSSNDEVYRCQATELLAATTKLPIWDIRQYAADLRSRNVSLGRLLRTLGFALFHRLVQFGVGYRLLIGLYNYLQRLRGAPPYPFQAGSAAAAMQMPVDDLNLQPGDIVKVKPHESIRATLNEDNKNRGLWFDAEMVPYCGREFRVLQRVDKIINEATGKMLQMKTPCIMLHDVVCKSAYTPGRLLCPRAIYPYWRESWLERVNGEAGRVSGDAAACPASSGNGQRG